MDWLLFMEIWHGLLTLLFVSIPQLKKSEVHPILGEKTACATVSLHLYVLWYKKVQCYLPLAAAVWLWGFYDEVYHVVEIIITEKNPYMGLVIQQPFYFSVHVRHRASKIANNDTESVTSDQGLIS